MLLFPLPCLQNIQAYREWILTHSSSSEEEEEEEEET